MIDLTLAPSYNYSIIIEKYNIKRTTYNKERSLLKRNLENNENNRPND